MNGLMVYKMWSYICSKGSIPDIGLWNFMFQVSLVTKVSILDVLDKPV